MFASWTFGRKLALGFVVACVALIVVAGVGYRSTESLVDTNAAVTHTQRVLRSLAELASLVKDAETGQRGFIVTGNDVFMEPYRNALGEIPRQLDELGALIKDSWAQQKLAALRPAIDTRLASLATTIALRQTSGFEPAAARIATGEGKRDMDRIRELIGAMEDHERGLLAERQAVATRSADISEYVLIGGSAAAILFVAIVGWLITSSLSRQVGVAVRHMQASAAELQAAATQQAASAREQASAMGEIATTINELLATSRQIADSAQQVSQIADQTASQVRAGDTTVGRGNGAVAEIRRQVDLVVTRMVELAAKSQQVGSVLDIVLELAEQTNILAINATIEAAGAGDAGRRFAVVADEIRRLADRVTTSAKEISGLVGDVRNAVNATVVTTETGSKAVDAGSRQFADVAAAFEQIATRVTTTTDAAKEIGLSTQQQATAVEQVTIAIANLSQAAKETETSTAQTQQTAAELATLSRDLVRLVQPQAAA